jgi:antitoxin CcdA
VTGAHGMHGVGGCCGAMPASERRYDAVFAPRETRLTVSCEFIGFGYKCAYTIRMANTHTSTRTRTQGKRAVNVSISTDLVERAKAAGINLSATLEAAIERELRDRERAAWLAENGEAIRAYNEDVEQRGVFSDGARTF